MSDASLIDSEQFQSLLEELAGRAGSLQSVESWPQEQLQLMSDAGVLGWLVPAGFGGGDVSEAELAKGYEQLAAACLTSTFVLTQRNAAIQRIVRSGNEELKADLLPELLTNGLFATVGISHLTTSRQHWKQPTVQVEQLDAGFIFNGVVPWVSGADRADIVVCGGTLEDGKQVLVALETCAEGVHIEEPVEMLSLNASRTASIRLENVFVSLEFLLHGPVEQVMKQGGGGAGSYTTSALAIGHSGGAVRHLKEEAVRRPDLEEIAAPFSDEYETLSADLQRALSDLDEDAVELSAESMRRRSNSLALRASQACLAASKGAGFVSGHPAARLVTEAMFFLVWSCPAPVLLGNLRELAGTAECSS